MRLYDDVRASSPALKFLSDSYRKPGVIYFTGAGSPPKPIKLGVTHQGALFRRPRAIHCTNHRDAHLLGVIPLSDGDTPLPTAEIHEHSLHQMIKDAQLRKPGTVVCE